MRSEITVFMLSVVLFTVIGFIWFFQYFDPFIRLYIINIPIFSSALVIVIYSLATITRSVKKEYLYSDVDHLSLQLKTQIGTSSNNITDIRLSELLRDIVGINEFARFLIGEFSIENLLFIIQISQYRAQFETDSNIDHLDDDNDDMDSSENMYKIASSVPTCAILLDHPNDYQTQAKKLINTFISNNAELVINIDSKNRNKVLSMEKDIDKLSFIQLKTLFDLPYCSVYRLIQLDSFARFKNSSSHQNVIKYIKRNQTFSKFKMVPKKLKQTISNRSNHHKNKHQQRQKEAEQEEESEIVYEISPSSPSSASSPSEINIEIPITTKMKSIRRNSSTINIVDIIDIGDGISIDMDESNNWTPTITENKGADVERLPSTQPKLLMDPENLANPFKSIVNQPITRNSNGNNVHFILYHAGKHTANLCCCR